MTTIPANLFARVLPSVLTVAGAAIDINALMLTTSTRVPIGAVQSFPDAASVSDFFGPSADEGAQAAVYFAGFTNADAIPGALLFAQYNEDAVAAYLRGGNAGSALTLAELQALSGSLTIIVDGTTLTDASLALSAATSFSSAASIIEAALDAAAPAGASVTGSIGGVVTASAGAEFTGTGAGTNLTVASITGVLHVGAQLSGTGVPAGTYIVSQTSGSAGAAGVYVTNHATTSSGDALVATSNILDVTAVASGTLHASDAISGTGVAAGTTILAQTSGSPGGVGLYTISSSQQFDSTSVTSLSTILNVTAVGSGTLEVGALLAGTAVTTGSIITAGITGSGGTGTYRLSEASTTISETITTTAVSPTVAYDSVSGAFVVTSGTDGATSTIGFATGTLAASLLLTSATGAVLSQGAAAAVPAAFMDDVVEQSTNWVTFMTIFDPDDADENTVKQAFAAWNTLQNNRYAYVCWDTDASPAAAVPATGSLGYILDQNGNSGTILIYAPDASLASFACGIAASIDFEKTNGRTTFAFRNQAGRTASVTTEAAAVNLGGNPQVTGSFGNGYNYYGAVGSANSNFQWFQRGSITGPFAWADSFINQVWLNNQFQLALLTLLNNAKSIPYNVAGTTLIESALADKINAGLNFGAFAPGDISAAQAAQVNTDAGANISQSLQTQGYYLQVLQASSSARASRTSPPCKFWYLDRGSVQSISLDSVALQ